MERRRGGTAPVRAPAPSPWRKRWIRTGVIVLLSLLALPYLILSPRNAERILFVPAEEDPGEPISLQGALGEEVWLGTSDGVRVHGWWYEAAPRAPAVLALHGNAGTVRDRAFVADGFLEQGISVFLLDWRGYGRSEGSPSMDGVLRDADAALDFVADRAGGLRRVVIHGHSLGGAVAAILARERPPAGLVLESTFTSVAALAEEHYPLPGLLLLRLRGKLDALAAVRELRSPVFFLHGTADPVVPVAMGLQLHAAAPDPKLWFALPGAGHNDMVRAGREGYFIPLATFAREVTGDLDPLPPFAPGERDPGAP